MTESKHMSAETEQISPVVWRVWVREYGAAKAIALALRSGFTREQILAVNRQLLHDSKALADRS